MYSKFALHVYVCVCVLTCAHSAAQSCPTLHKIHQQIFQPYQVDVLIDVLLLLLLSRFSHVRLCVTPQAAAHQAPLSLGLSRQEHGSVLPFPSLMRESEVAQLCPTQRPHVLQPTRLLRPWDFPGKSTEVGGHCLLQIDVLDPWK